MHRSSKLPYLFLAISACLAVSALVLLFLRSGQSPTVPEGRSPAAPPLLPESKDATKSVAPTPSPPPSDHAPAVELPHSQGSPDALVHEIARAFEQGDVRRILELTGKASHDPLTRSRMEQLAALRLPLGNPGCIRQIGESSTNQSVRWALDLPGQQQIDLDLRFVGNQWQVERIQIRDKTTHPASPTPLPSDPLAVVDSFLQSVLHQRFEESRPYVDPMSISDAKLAGLCILFEEGGYSLRQKMPIRLVLQRGDTAGFLVMVDAREHSHSTAQFAINLRQNLPSGHWIITEINLDSLLADYARTCAQGDVHYTPLVKNPSGGDTLALYFDFDSGTISTRARRQLEIVARILKSDPKKKIHISGHTDALGTDEYNRTLSRARADATTAFLASAGVPSSQIVMNAFGSSQPRRPNVTDSGQDNPDGRRVNRRAEIFLDF